MVLSSGFAYGQTIVDTVTIGTGTSSSTSYGPIYRSSATSSFDRCRYSYLFTASELAAVGVPLGATIKGVAWDKVGTSTTNGGADFDIYAENTAATSLAAGTWASTIGTATQVHTSTNQMIPGTAGWLFFNFANNFVYGGGNMQVSTNWDISGVTGSPTTGGFNWRNTSESGKVIGRASGSATTVNSLITYTRRPNIRIIYEFTPKSDDLAIGTRTSPSSGCLGTTETVTVDINNIGLNMATNFQVGFQVTDPVSGVQFPVVETIADTLLSGAGMTYTFVNPANMTTSGTHALSTFIIYPVDQDNSNNGQVDSVINEKLVAPFIETLEGFPLGTGTFPYKGWINGGGQTPWRGDQGTTPSGSTGPNVDHTFGTSGGTFLYLEANSLGNGGQSLMISPCIDLDTVTCPKLRFWYHMYGANMGSLHVDVSTDGGMTWIDDVMPPIVGQQHLLSGSPWLEATASLGNYAGSTINLRFRGVDGSSALGDMAIDDIEIYGGSGDDIGITGISSPSNGCSSGAEPITIEIWNNGCSTIPANSISAGFVSQGPVNTGPVAETVPDSIAPGETISYTFTATANLSSAGGYNLGASVSFLPTSGFTDGNATNNTLTDSVTNPLVNAPWIETFETWGGSEKWTW